MFLRKLLSAVNACLQELSFCLCGNNPEVVVDFCMGIEEGSNIAFHFRVYTNSMVVMNSFQKGGWQEEKRMFSDPFMPGQPFELRFLVLENEYKVCGPSWVWSAMAMLGLLWRNTRRVQL